METKNNNDTLLDTIYVEDLPQYRDYWIERSEFFDMKTKCYENIDYLISDADVMKNGFAKVLVTDFDLDHYITGGELGHIVRDEYSYQGPLVMSSSCKRNLCHFDLEITKANVIEVIDRYFPEKVDAAKAKLLSTPVDTWTSGEFAFALKKGWYKLPPQINYRDHLLQYEVDKLLKKEDLYAFLEQEDITISYKNGKSFETRSKEGIWLYAQHIPDSDKFQVTIYSEYHKEPLQKLIERILEFKKIINEYLIQIKPKKKVLIFRKDMRVLRSKERFEKLGFECTCVNWFCLFEKELENDRFDLIVVGAVFNDCTLEQVVDLCYKKACLSYLLCCSNVASSVPEWFTKSGGDLIVNESSFDSQKDNILELFDKNPGLLLRKKRHEKLLETVKMVASISFALICTITSLTCGFLLIKSLL